MEDDEGSEVHQLWESVDDDFLKFDLIPEADRPCTRPDVCAFLLLAQRFPTERKADMVCSAEHDQIWLDVSDEQIALLTKDEVLYLTRCGVMHDAEVDSLSMFV